MNYSLAPYVSSGFQNGTLYLGFGSIQKKFTTDEQISKVMKMLSLATKNTFTDSDLVQINKELDIDSRFFIKENSYNREDRHSRHHLFYSLCGASAEDTQKRIASKSVAIIGCGGIGNIISVNLATAGVGRIVLIDQDNIELSNLTRQILFLEKDLGKSKTEVLKCALQDRASNIKVEIYSEKLPNQHVFDVIKTCDFAVLSVDAPGLVPQFNRWANKEKVPWINVGYINDIAVFGPMVIPGVTGCTHCQNLVAVAQNNSNDWSEVLNQNNRHTQAPSIGPVNMMAASMASLDILKYLGEFGQIKSLNKRVGLWTHDFHIEEQDCSKNPNCRVCGHE